MKSISIALLFTAVACHKGTPDPISAVPNASASAPVLSGAHTVAPDSHASIGRSAPDFTLTDLSGNPVSLHDYAGKRVVLEWFNPECPFINLAHTKGSLKGMAARREAQGVVWLAINSSASGKQGYGVDANVAGKAKFGFDHPILLDPTGAVGHAYGATNTPNMFVIDERGTLVYRGAIDNSPDGEGESPTNGKLVNYVDAALDALAAKREVEVKETRAYGCGVKFGS